jgi:hypothetical protein
VAFDFPATPYVGQAHVSDNLRWSWNGAGWERGSTQELPVSVFSIDPITEWHDNPAFTLTVTGENFILLSEIIYNGAAVATTHVSDTQMTASITPPAIGGAVSATVNVTDAITPDFTITYVSRPFVTDIDPDGAGQGDPAFTLTVTGNYFVAASQILYNGAGVATTFVSATELTCSVTPPAVGGATSATVNVTGATSADFPLQFAVKPIITSITPIDNDHAPGQMESVYVFANNIVSGDVINFNGVDLATTWRTTYLEAKIEGAAFADGLYPVFIKHGSVHSNTFNADVH